MKFEEKVSPRQASASSSLASQVAKEQRPTERRATAADGSRQGAEEGKPSLDRQRRLRWVGMALGVFLLLSFVLATLQPATLPQWSPAANRIQQFFHPIEANRWQRPTKLLPRTNTIITSVAYAPNGQSALAVGGVGTLLRSTDNGTSWTVITSGTQYTLHSVTYAPDGQSALAVGIGGTMLRSGDEGQSWTLLASGSKEDLTAVAYAPNGQSALAVGMHGELLRSADAGQTWRRFSSGSMKNIYSVAYEHKGQSVLAVGEDDTLLRSTDAGISWTVFASGSKAHLYSVAYEPNGQSALVAGEDGTLLRSADARQSWTVLASGSKERLTSVAYARSGQSALVAGDEGTLLRSANAGLSWTALAGGSKAYLTSVAYAPNSQSALAAGIDGTMLRSLDSGQTWQQSATYAKSPGPWFWALLVALSALALGYASFQSVRASVRQARKGVLDYGVSDRPISGLAQDHLKFGPIAEALRYFLRHQSTAPRMAIAINAAWGMGKSSMMKLLSDKLDEWGGRTVHFNVWHHQHEELLLVPLLNAVVKQAIPGIGTWRGLRFRVKLFWVRFEATAWQSWMGLIAVLSVPGYAASLLWRGGLHVNGPQVWVDLWVGDVTVLVEAVLGGSWLSSVKGNGLFELAGAVIIALRSEVHTVVVVLLALLFLGCWVILWGYMLRPFPTSPSVLLASLGKSFSLSKAEAQSDFRQRFRLHFAEVASALAPGTMTIFIDDLDRCKPEKAAELLEAVNYLIEAGDCFVVLGMARDLVEAQVASAHKTLAEEDAALVRARAEGAKGDRDAELAVDQSEAAKGPPMPNPAHDRLLYARKYLRKLVQLDVRLPSLEAAQGMQMLLGGQAEAPQGAGFLTASRMIAVRVQLIRCGGVAGMLALLTYLLFASHHSLTTIGKDRDTVSSMLNTQLRDDVRVKMEEVRQFEQWNRLQADVQKTLNAKSSTAPTGKQSLAGKPVVEAVPSKESAYRAKAEMVAGLVKTMEQELPAMEQIAREGRKKAFDDIKKGHYRQAAEAFEHLTNTSVRQLDGQTWDEIKAAQVKAVLGGKEGKQILDDTSPPERVRPEAVPIVTSEVDAQPASQPLPWLGLLLCLLPVGVIFALAAKAVDTYVPQPTPEYEASVKECIQGLLANPLTSSPRELKRFMNLSRYVVARLHSTLKDEALRVPESTCVELTARWLQAQVLASGPGDTGLSTESNYHLKYTDRERQLFNGVVGDIG